VSQLLQILSTHLPMLFSEKHVPNPELLVIKAVLQSSSIQTPNQINRKLLANALFNNFLADHRLGFGDVNGPEFVVKGVLVQQLLHV